MTDSEKKCCSCVQNAKIIEKKQDCVVYKIANEKGEMVKTDYTVFPGIHLIYNDVHTPVYSLQAESSGNILEISHCREGRIEGEYKDEFYYLAAGDMSVSFKNTAKQEYCFPKSHYHGISIEIDIDRAPNCLSCILDDINVCPSALIKKYAADSQCFIMRSKPCLEHIFSELYSVPDSIKKGYFKVKILELMLFLSGMEIDTNLRQSRLYSKSQVTLAKNACEYLTKNMNRRITINELADTFHVSPTQLKNSFKGVYGVSVYSYIRSEKMQSAALLLEQTNCTILDIAGRYGYDNGSKFAKAFKDTIGMTPNEYRNHCKKQEAII